MGSVLKAGCMCVSPPPGWGSLNLCALSPQSIVSKNALQFRGSSQHDAQEFLLWLLDRVHEDLHNLVKNSDGGAPVKVRPSALEPFASGLAAKEPRGENDGRPEDELLHWLELTGLSWVVVWFAFLAGLPAGVTKGLYAKVSLLGGRPSGFLVSPVLFLWTFRESWLSGCPWGHVTESQTDRPS